MNSSIIRNRKKNQMSLYFDCLTPEEAFKIMDLLFESHMDEYLCEHMLDVNLGYCVDGYRVDDESIRYSHELLLSIETPEVTEFESGLAIEAQLKEDGDVLTVLRHIILKATGIKEES